jgi:O-acetyl-ADP-ribose deacetylase (regulator of RNase III)
MKAKHIIHTNGPKYHESDTSGKLARATESAMRVADENNISQLAFPPIGTGLYQVPLDLSARVMLETVERHLRGQTTLKEVAFVALDKREHTALEAQLKGGN